MNIFIILLTVLASLTALLAVMFTVECAVAAAPTRKRYRFDAAHKQPRRNHRTAVLVPAHNEELQIAETLTSIQSQLLEDDLVLVVADNCTDKTKRVASACGAIVVERNDPSRRGKSYALDYGIQTLRSLSSPEQGCPDVVVVVDADCRVSVGALDSLSSKCKKTNRPVQGRYLMHAANLKGPKSVVSQLAILVKNHVRLLGMDRLGLPCLLTGSGMAFPWEIANTLRFDNGHIVEDMQLGCDLAIVNKGTLFCEEAVITSELPSDNSAQETQRRRWEHGHLSVLTNEVPRLLLEAVKQRRISLLLLAIDLAIPPLSLLVLITVSLWIVSLVFSGYSTTPLAITTSTIILLSTAILLSWLSFARNEISLIALIKTPGYALKKIPLYLSYLFYRQQAWVRTPRNRPPHQMNK